MEDVLAPVPLGIALGLVLGKPIGIVGAALLMRAPRLGALPRGHGLAARCSGLGLLCGIGFTMSLFIGSLAYRTTGGCTRKPCSASCWPRCCRRSRVTLWLRATLPRPELTSD